MTKYQIVFDADSHHYFTNLFIKLVAKRLVKEYQVLAHVAF